MKRMQPDPLQRNDGGMVATVGGRRQRRAPPALSRAHLWPAAPCAHGHTLRRDGDRLRLGHAQDRDHHRRRSAWEQELQGPLVPTPLPAAPPAVFLLIDHRSDVTGGRRGTRHLRPGHHERRGYAVAAFRCGRGGTRRSGDIPHRESSICRSGGGPPLPGQCPGRRWRPSGAGERASSWILVTDRAVTGSAVSPSSGTVTRAVAGARSGQCADPRFALVVARRLALRNRFGASRMR